MFFVETIPILSISSSLRKVLRYHKNSLWLVEVQQVNTMLDIEQIDQVSRSAVENFNHAILFLLRGTVSGKFC